MASTREEIQNDLEEQVAQLNKQVAQLTKAMSKRSAAALAEGRDSAAELYDDLHGRFADAMPGIRRQARVAQKTAQDNPLATALVGVALLGLVAALVARR
ncbi:MAG: hypothetical protein LCH86_17435 [Proteobacteria bacterium]|uniref:hypothetical protein n=1 Tax=Hyphomicrobiales TaxID=356 RepID=UPI00037A785A|nr:MULTISPECIES: hypothetical protein [Phyllobacteriaceae]MCA0277779.1 hypothetical protein [Pseudomonadota bacterium]MCX8571701.1 hypothetical protein [Aminobacter sp. MET-1]